MAMTIDEMEAKLDRLERDMDELRASVEFERSVEDLRVAIAEIDSDPGMSAEEFFEQLRRERAARRAARA